MDLSGVPPIGPNVSKRAPVPGGVGPASPGAGTRASPWSSNPGSLGVSDELVRPGRDYGGTEHRDRVPGSAAADPAVPAFQRAGQDPELQGRGRPGAGGRADDRTCQ